jgi:hypothetical protein
MKGSHKMAIERVLVAIKGRKMKKGKNVGVGAGETHCGNQKIFYHHMRMVTEKLSIATCGWW